MFFGKGQYGNVRYFVQATLDIPWDLYDKKITKPFTVLRYEDLNYMSGMREPREVQIQKQIDSSAWFFSRSSLGLVTIKGFYPLIIYIYNYHNYFHSKLLFLSVVLHQEKKLMSMFLWITKHQPILKMF